MEIQGSQSSRICVSVLILMFLICIYIYIIHYVLYIYIQKWWLNHVERSNLLIRTNLWDTLHKKRMFLKIGGSLEPT